MTDANRSNTGMGISGAGGTGDMTTIGTSGGSAPDAGGTSSAGIAAPGGTRAVKAEPVKRAATKSAARKSTNGGKTARASGEPQSATAKVRAEAAKVRGQATDKARSLATQGKDRATGALDDVARMVNDAAAQVDERLGPQYGGYARSAADAVAGFASTLREKDVDELVADARNFVRKSPAVAIGAAAAIGFVLARIVKSGAGPQDNGRRGGGA